MVSGSKLFTSLNENGRIDKKSINSPCIISCYNIVVTVTIITFVVVVTKAMVTVVMVTVVMVTVVMVIVVMMMIVMVTMMVFVSWCICSF